MMTWRATQEYSKQKDTLEEEFTNFLSAIPGEKHLRVATAKDVVRFLALKDKSGRTKVHSPQCRYFSFSTGSKQTVCKCPTRQLTKFTNPIKNAKMTFTTLCYSRKHCSQNDNIKLQKACITWVNSPTSGSELAYVGERTSCRRVCS